MHGKTKWALLDRTTQEYQLKYHTEKIPELVQRYQAAMNPAAVQERMRQQLKIAVTEGLRAYKSHYKIGTALFDKKATTPELT